MSNQSEADVSNANESGINRISSLQGFFPNNNKLRFHERKGSLIKLSNNNRTSERRRPYDEFNNGVVMTHRPLRDNELFEIRIDRLVDKWSGSIEVGMTSKFLYFSNLYFDLTNFFQHITQQLWNFLPL